MARSVHHKNQPVTPQRFPSQRLAHRYSSSQSLHRSPVTPTTPYTPLSLRSFTSSTSGISSALNTPDNDGISRDSLFSPNIVSPLVRVKDRSLADIADNWRSRANENGIKVSSINDGSHYADDEASERTTSDAANDSGFISAEEALLAPSLISSQRVPSLNVNRPRAQSHLPRPFSSPLNPRNPTRHLAQPSSPLALRRSNQSQNTNAISTPPPNRTLVRQLKLKGSLTDPPRTRKREAFGAVWTPTQQNANKIDPSFTLGLNQDTSLDLFDINETDLETDLEYTHDNQMIANDSLTDQQLFHLKDTTFDNNLNVFGYPNYPLPPLPSYNQHQAFLSQSQAPFSDPFHGNALGRIPESVEHYFHTQQPFRDTDVFMNAHPELPLRNQAWGLPCKPPVLGSRSWDVYTGGPAWVPIPAPSNILPAKSAKADVQVNKGSCGIPSPSGCSVCLAASPRTLAVLDPCNHPLCSACLTSALNIVGEKDMECAVCRGKVEDFKLVPADMAEVEDQQAKQRTDTGQGRGKVNENIVLRIDNVPWDITPPQIQKWLQQPLVRVHVLLDKRGKTLSHAYVEVADVAIAGKILRGEAQGDSNHEKLRERGSVLGKGRRARGVTVTRCGQEELMTDLFPNWRGTFDGSRPSLAGLDSDQIITALEGGLISESEVVGLLHLIKEPDHRLCLSTPLSVSSANSLLTSIAVYSGPQQ
ncbi:hypothetical protein H0H93_006467 [Arthromyces matolae]|nr:hypothetical protein H0H93_006467 [Arthromyces matolae]